MKQQQIQQLKAALYDCIFDHSQLHSMYTCGPRDEITGIRAVNHIDPNARFIRQLRNPRIIVVAFASGVNQASRLQVGKKASPRL